MNRPSFVMVALLLVTTSSALGVEIEIPAAPASPSFVFPKPSGPYSVGVRAFAWIDRSREESATPESGDYREVTVQMWYPASLESDAQTAAYTPEIEEILAAASDVPEDSKKFIKMHAPLRGAATTSIADADIAKSPEPWPVILFSPGGNVSRHWQTALAERLASRGFVFVSMSHPYSTIDVAPVSGFSMSIDWGLNQEDEEAAAAADDRLANILAGDAIFVLERLGELAKSGAFADRLRLDRVGLAGHSRGGTTVGRACASDARFAVCAVLDNIGPDREQKTGVPSPMLALRSPWPEQRIKALHNYLGRTGSVAYDVELADSNHFTCTDLPLFMPDLRVEGVEPIDGIDTCSTILVDFFDSYLRRQIPLDASWTPKIDADKVRVKRF